MGDYFSKGHHWRARAEMTRTIADGMVGPNRDALLRVADEYDRLAERLEREEKLAERMRRDTDRVAKAEYLEELRRRWRGESQ